jgi:hypothetical protein
MEARTRTRRILHRSGVAAALCLMFVACPSRSAAEPNDATYPEKGKVIVVRVDETIEYAPIMPPDSKGRTHGGEAFVHRKQMYRVQTNNEVYELEGGRKADLTVGDSVEFRVHKNSAEVRVDGSTRKYRIIYHSSVTK